jgi:hypothetical protein
MAISTINQAGLNAPLTLTSPVLTTPNLGTPSAINLSNATALPASALPTGCILQVVSQQNGQTLTSTSGSVTLLTQSFTPKSATSKVLLHANFCVERLGGGTGNYIFANFSRNGTPITASGMSGNWMNAPGYQLANGVRSTGSSTYLDSPATTSAITYSIVADFSTSGNVPWQFYILNLTLLEVAG